MFHLNVCLRSGDVDSSEQPAGERVDGADRPVLAAIARGTPKVTVEDVDDLTSVVVVKVLDHLERGTVIDGLEMYAKAVARNAFYGHVRRRDVNLMLAPAGRQDPTEDTDWLEGMGRALGLGSSPSEQVIRRDDAHRYSRMIIDALTRLTPP